MVDILLDAVTGRFEDSSIKDLDRLVETKNYFKSADLVDILFGRGLFGTHDSLGSLTDALHIGWADYIFRGGVFLFAFALVPTLRAVTLLPSMDLLDTRTQWAVCITCIYAVKLLYGNLHNHSPELPFVFFSYAVVMKWRFDGNEGAYGSR